MPALEQARGCPASCWRKMRPAEGASQAVQSLRDAAVYYARFGITVHRVSTENGVTFRPRGIASAFPMPRLTRQHTASFATVQDSSGQGKGRGIKETCPLVPAMLAGAKSAP